MNVKQLYNNINNMIDNEEFNGEVYTSNNYTKIIWSYSLTNDYNNEYDDDYDDDEYSLYCYDSNNDELLLEEYENAFNSITDMLLNHNEIYNWNISDYDLKKNVISFVITNNK